MNNPCQHSRRTVPSDLPIKGEGSQEVVGTATIRVCLECGHVEGTVTNGSLLSPTAPAAFEVEPEGDIGEAARRALGT
jgi:hypothetical protein